MKKFRKNYLVIIIGIICSLSLIGCNSNNDSVETGSTNEDNKKIEATVDKTSETDEKVTEEENNDSSDTISDGFKFIVGFDASFPPYGYLEDGEYVGFDIDLAKEVAKRNNWEIELRPIDWPAKDMELSSGAINCIWNGFTINGREELYTWTKPYVDNSQVVMVSADSGITTLEDLKDKVVVVQDDSSAYKALIDEEGDLLELKDSFKELKLIPDYNAAFMDLQAGAVDAVALDVGVAKYQLENRDGEFIILEEILVKEEYGVGFLLGETELRDKVQDTLLEMFDDGTLLEVAEKWELEDSVVLEK